MIEKPKAGTGTGDLSKGEKPKEGSTGKENNPAVPGFERHLPEKCAHCGRQGAVYKTHGRTRYIKCNACGKNWKESSSYFEPCCQSLKTMLDAFEKAEPEMIEGKPYLIIDYASVGRWREDLEKILVAK